MNVIGAGFGRTGTMSLKLALDHLGFGPTLHASEFRKYEENQHLNAAWHWKANGHPVPWDKLLEGYESAVDWPVSYYWREMAEAYPDAKVILTVRPAREWLASFKATILPHLLRGVSDPMFQHTAIRIILGSKVFNDDFSDENLLRCYARNNVDVKAFDPARLLVFNVKDGWKPLCKFLEVLAPETPFPQSNDVVEFEQNIKAA